MKFTKLNLNFKFVIYVADVSRASRGNLRFVFKQFPPCLNILPRLKINYVTIQLKYMCNGMEPIISVQTRYPIYLKLYTNIIFTYRLFIVCAIKSDKFAHLYNNFNRDHHPDMPQNNLLALEFVKRE